MHSVPFALFCFVRLGASTLDALADAISAGGDTDSFGAILGGWLGALHGEQGLPAELVGRIQDGPYGPTHLRALARALDTGAPPERRSWLASLAANLLLYPVVIAHGLRRLLP